MLASDMLHQPDLASRAEDPLELFKCSPGRIHATENLRSAHGVEACVIERKRFSGATNNPDLRYGSIRCLFGRRPQVVVC